MSRSRFASLVAAALWIGGCASAPTAGGVVPDDLTVDVTVLRGSGTVERPEAHLRRARFVLFPDGSLRYGDEHDADFLPGPDWLPEPTRAIGSETMREVWELIERLGLTDPAVTEPPPELDEIESVPGMLTYISEVTANGRSRALIERVPDDPDARGASIELVRMLSRLAWATDLPESRLLAVPHRYDFGPDPYARFRRP